MFMRKNIIILVKNAGTVPGQRNGAFPPAGVQIARDSKSGISCEGDTDKVHQVIAGKGKSEGESTHQNHNFEDIYLAPMQYLHQYGEEYKETGYKQCGIVVYP